MILKPTQILFSPMTVTFLAFIACAIIQLEVVYPVEAKLLPVYSATASLMYLPHAVRVLATVIIGPRAFFVLLPATMVTEFLRVHSFAETHSLTGVLSGRSLLYIIAGAACAPIAYILVKAILDGRIEHSKALLNWRYVFLIGIVASAINAICLVILSMMPAEATVILAVMLRFFIGDIFGLLVGLIVLTLIFRMLRFTRAT